MVAADATVQLGGQADVRINEARGSPAAHTSARVQPRRRARHIQNEIQSHCRDRGLILTAIEQVERDRRFHQQATGEKSRPMTTPLTTAASVIEARVGISVIVTVRIATPGEEGAYAQPEAGIDVGWLINRANSAIAQGRTAPGNILDP